MALWHRATAGLVLVAIFAAGWVARFYDLGSPTLHALLMVGPVLLALAYGALTVAFAIARGTGRYLHHRGQRLRSRLGIVDFAARHPRLAGFVAARFDRTRPGGLTATLLVSVFVYILSLYLDTVYDLLKDGAVAEADDRLANLAFALRDHMMIAIFSAITAFGGWKAIAAVLLGSSAALVALRRGRLLLALWVTVIGNQLTVTVAKAVFGRPRSSLGYFVETSNSFPSGHAASSVAIWGMLFYLGWRTRLLSARIAILAGVCTAGLLGTSRIYLVVHYLSDVLNGWLVGAMWLLIGISICEWRLAGLRESLPPRPRAAALLLALGLAGAVGISALSDHARNPAPEIVAELLDDPAALARPDRMARVTKWLDGRDAGRIGLLVEAEDAGALSRGLERAGWRPGGVPTLASVARGLLPFADSTGGAVPVAFWDSRPNLLGFHGPDGTSVARAWFTRTRLRDGGQIFAISVTDRGGEGGGAHLLAETLRQAGATGTTASNAPGAPIILTLPSDPGAASPSLQPD